VQVDGQPRLEKNGLMVPDDRQGLNRHATLAPQPAHADLIAYQVFEVDRSPDEPATDAAEGDGDE
jgi:hypothetical protein